MKEKIDEFKIESLAYVLLAEMQTNKNWRESIQTSENSELRRIRNNFNFYKIKKSETIEGVKEQSIVVYKRKCPPIVTGKQIGRAHV